MPRFSLRGMFVAIALVAIGIGVLVSISQYLDRTDPFNRLPFDPAIWAQRSVAEAGPTSRRVDRCAAMARDLTRHHLPTGLSRANVIARLGSPDAVLTFKDDGGNRLRGVETYTYYIGAFSDQGFDSAYVYVYLDQSGNVVGAEITGY